MSSNAASVYDDWPADVPRPPRGEDLPHTDGVPMESWRHQTQMMLLVRTLDLHWADRDDVFVGGNMFFYFSATQARNNDFRGPDVMVVLGCERRERKSWVVWEEDGRVPSLVVELLSDTTAAVDRGEKKRIYARLGVTEYVLYHPFTHELEAFRLQDGTFQPCSPGTDGRYRSSTTGLVLGLWQGTHARVQTTWLRWHDAEGRPIPTEAERAVAEGQRADAEDERARSEAERAEAEAERAEAEAERAEAEAERARALEARLAAYEARFGALDEG